MIKVPRGASRAVDAKTAVAAIPALVDAYRAWPRASVRRCMLMLSRAVGDHISSLARFAEALEAVDAPAAALAAWERVKALGFKDVNSYERRERLAFRLRAKAPDGRFLVIGNCQALGVASCLRALRPGAEVRGELWTAHAEPAAVEALLASLDGYDLVLTQAFGRGKGALTAQALKARSSRVVDVPRLYFDGFHPDLVRPEGKPVAGAPFRVWHSAIIAAGYRMGLSRARVADLFNAYIYGSLGYFDAHERAVGLQLEEGRRMGVPLEGLLAQWRARGESFVHMPDHPKAWALHDLAKALCLKHGVRFDAEAEARDDPQATRLVWPVYPEIARRLGVNGDLMFLPQEGGDALDLEAVVARYFQLYDAHGAPRGEREEHTESTLRKTLARTE